MLGLIAALWISLAPPEPATFDEVVEIASPSEPAPSEPAPSEPVPVAESAEPIAIPPPVPVPAVEIAVDRRREKRIRRPIGKTQPWKGTWRGWGAPLLSAFVPGLGQIANGEVVKGVALIYGSIAALAGSLALYSSTNDGTRPVGAEYARLISYGVFSTALPMLWRFAITDAYRVANEKAVAQPNLDHKLRLSLSRTMVVGFRADPDRPGFYDEWSAAAVGQVARRLSLGVSDLTIKPHDWRIDVVQFGARVDYRVLDRRRLWIDLAFGTAVQIKLRRPAAPLDPDVLRGPLLTKFGVVPYVQIDLRWFVLDRVSFDFVPRLSVPLTTRYFSAGRALPRFAPTLEIGAGGSLYF